MTTSTDTSLDLVVEAVRELRITTGKASVSDVARVIGRSRSTTHRLLVRAVESERLEVLSRAGYRTTDE